MIMNRKYPIFLVLLSLFLSFVGCDTKIKPLEVVTPVASPDFSKLEAYKKDFSNRPVTIGYLYHWEKGGGYSLMNTPDSLDVVVLKNAPKSLSENLQKDLQDVRQLKQTRVLFSIDIASLQKAALANLKTQIKKGRKELEKSWNESPQKPDRETQKAELAKLENTLKGKLSAEMKQEVTSRVSDLLQMLKANAIDGLNVQLPETFELCTVEDALTWLRTLTAEAGKGKPYFLAVETPCVECRSEIEKAQWIVYNQKEEPLWKNFSQGAETWKNSLYFPSVDLSDSKLTEGFADSRTLAASAAERSRENDVINWKASNKGGVAYFHIEEMAFKYESGYSYGPLRRLINNVQIKK